MWKTLQSIQEIDIRNDGLFWNRIVERGKFGSLKAMRRNEASEVVLLAAVAIAFDCFTFTLVDRFIIIESIEMKVLLLTFYFIAIFIICHPWLIWQAAVRFNPRDFFLAKQSAHRKLENLGMMDMESANIIKMLQSLLDAFENEPRIEERMRRTNLEVDSTSASERGQLPLFLTLFIFFR